MSRNLRMFSLLAIALFAVATLQAQVCTPDSQYTEIGLYPDSLPVGIIGQPYEQVVHVVVPQDTMVELPPFGILTVSLCELTLDSIPNLPAGMTYECSGGNCTWEIDHTPGVINRFCVKLSGTPTEGVSPDDSLLVFATVTPGAYNANTGNCDALTITLPDSLTTIEYKTALKLESGANGIAADLNPLKLSVFPNPGSGESTSISFSTAAAQSVAVTVYSVRGERVLSEDQGVMAAGSHEVSLNTAQLPAGMYVIEVRAGATRQSSTWIRQ